MFLKIDGKLKFVNSSTRLDAMIRGFKLLGFEPILFSVWGGYKAFLAPNGVRYLLGIGGTLRATGTNISESISLTNSHAHKSILRLGMGISVDVDALRDELAAGGIGQRNLAKYQC